MSAKPAMTDKGLPVRVGWLADSTDVLGGAELTQAEFRAAAPPGVRVIDCPPDGVVPGLDRYVIQNCVKYQLEDFTNLTARTVKYWHDVGPHLHPGVREWLSVGADQICCSPVQAAYMGLDVPTIPPPVDLARFETAADEAGLRAGSCCVGSWRNFGKGWHRVGQWSQATGEPVDFYGGGQLAPHGSREVPYEAMPSLLAQYHRFVFLPTVIEPFGRLVAEAWAAGCEVVTNGLVGSRYWIEERPEAIGSAAADFWVEVLR